MKWQIEYLVAAEKWLNKLSCEKLKSLAKELELLALCGKNLRLPHSKTLTNNLYELRERKYGLRIYYIFNGGRIILLKGGNKDSQKKDIVKVKKLLIKWEKNHEM